MIKMFKTIRNISPFIMLGYSLLFAVASYFDFYKSWFIYLPDLLGFSLFTNLFMFSVYMNKRYCTATKIAVCGLMLLNIFNLLYKTFEIDGVIYDLYLIIIVVFLVIIYKLEK